MRRFLVVPLCAILLIIAILGAVPKLAPAAAGNEVAVASAGQTAYEIVGKADQAGQKITNYGYLTSITGLDSSALFTTSDPFSRTASAARFTYSGVVTLTERSVLDNLFVTTARGEISFYFNESGGASFDNPASFASGRRVAKASIRSHDTLIVIAPDTGLLSATAEVTQLTADTFVLNGQQYTFGRANLIQRMSTSGSATRTDPILPSSIARIAGYATPAGLLGQQLYLPLIFRNAQQP